MMSDFYKRTRKNYVDDEGMARGRNLENWFVNNFIIIPNKSAN